MRVKSYNSMHFHHYTGYVMSQNVPVQWLFEPVLLCLARLHLMYLQNLLVLLKQIPQSDTETVFTYSARISPFGILLSFLSHHTQDIQDESAMSAHHLLYRKGCHIIRKTARIHRNLFLPSYLKHHLLEASKFISIYHL